MMIAILCDAGPDLDGSERKLSILLDQEGCRHETRIGWPDVGDVSIHWGLILHITREEYILQENIAYGNA